MTLGAAREAWRKLSPDERAFVRSPKLSGSATPSEWIEQLARVARYDGHANAVISMLGKVLLAWVVAFFLILVSLIIVGGLPGILGVLHAAMVPATLVAAVVTFAYRSSWKAVDVPDVLAFTALPLLRVLELELPEGVPVELELDLVNTERLELMVDEQKTGAMLTVKRHDKIYQHPWLSLRTTVGAGAGLRLTMEDTLRVRRQTRRNARGKLKTKIKRKVKRRIRACLAVRPDRGLAAVSGAQVTVRPSGKRQQIHSEVREEGGEALFATQPIVLIRLIARCFAHAEKAA